MKESLTDLTKIRAAIASKSFKDFVSYTKSDYVFNWHHLLLIDYLQKFAEGKIKKTSLEAVAYAHGMGGSVTALALGTVEAGDLAALGKFGAKTSFLSTSILCVFINFVGVHTIFPIL